ncbi:dihydroorotate dehydrogenase electron transfer subunit [Candidatus Peregrinibacteria bacterium]|jgi:dihydroorotate dehydrogenase electron transfer subunit|nr:dihydroorotate dehydrogenase electron transfer subunit [Candidatus Peregrinibacteria bacterium]MBT7484467.1 dihydroorotate dehydrogenase electron transfer subunit [Candidatus Peregrinibacteria bacterium]MBT7702809.1 dihydroorotate dehydrogenase electron transfer subunit [Candidatus Peregrinibacteria bacterium]
MPCQSKNDIPKTVKVLDIKSENPFVKTFTLDISVGAQPGQFVMIWIPRLNEKPFSVAFDDGNELKIAIAAVGEFSNAMHDLKVGDKVGVRGPYGKPFEYEDSEHLAVIGGGYGAAPLYFLAHEAVERGCKVEFVVGARNKENLLFLNRAGMLADTNVHVATDDGSEGHKGYNVPLLEKLMDEGLKVDRMLTVGPEMMMIAVSDLALKHDLPCQVSVERYMKCGFGVCGQCVVDESGMPTCLKGPVMDHKLAREQVEFGKYHRDRVGRKQEW